MSKKSNWIIKFQLMMITCGAEVAMHDPPMVAAGAEIMSKMIEVAGGAEEDTDMIVPEVAVQMISIPMALDLEEIMVSIRINNVVTSEDTYFYLRGRTTITAGCNH